MSHRLQLLITVAAVAIAAAGAVLGITLATRETPPPLQAQPTKPPVPPTNLPGPAGKAIRQAFVNWPHGSVAALERLSQEYPKDPITQLYYGVGLLWAGYVNEAQQVLEGVKSKGIGYDTHWEVAADNILHPQFFTGYPVFTPTEHNVLLERGSRLQVQGHQHSAEKLYQQAAREQPGDVEAQVAAGVGAFDKDNLVPSFSRLGPLVARFPHSQLVHFYLGLELAWTAQRNKAVDQFRTVIAMGATTALANEAKQFLKGVGATASASSGK